jgi:hypothetical protein
MKTLEFEGVSINLDWALQKTEQAFFDEIKHHEVFKEKPKILKEAWKLVQSFADGSKKELI